MVGIQPTRFKKVELIDGNERGILPLDVESKDDSDLFKNSAGLM